MYTTLKSTRSGWTYLLLYVFVISMTSCNDDDDNDDAPSTVTPVTVDFGANYSVVQGATGQGGVELPVLAGDSLLVRVGWSGCNNNHEFEFQSRILSDTRAEIWLRKVTPDQDCAAYFTSDQSFRVPFNILNKEEIFLLGPNFYSVDLR